MRDRDDAPNDAPTPSRSGPRTGCVGPLQMPRLSEQKSSNAGQLRITMKERDGREEKKERTSDTHVLQFCDEEVGEAGRGDERPHGLENLCIWRHKRKDRHTRINTVTRMRSVRSCRVAEGAVTHGSGPLAETKESHCE